ncbi:PAS domain S-box protein [Ferruginibacter paludis]|uniref:PAS domain S-box protein n=1 Tax=Ferruginibacter paludis TaxID=1310417 RepID=UPI0025B56984|nr:PAS domain S-box protein [Ferruginibacter paludis]MDN3657043.1 PAS domain S-box protein [Ferruginibacter paludis]
MQNKPLSTIDTLQKSFKPIEEIETSRLIYELEVHQIELEMQNEELLQTQNQVKEEVEKLAAYARKYATLYDFAPSGYCTLSRAGDIMELNLSAAKMLGKDRGRLINNRLALYVSPETQPRYHLFLESIFNDKAKHTCEIILSVNERSPMHVLLAGTVDETEERCFINVIDITERKQAKETLLLQNKISEQHTAELVLANRELTLKSKENEKLTAALNASNKKLITAMQLSDQAVQKYFTLYNIAPCAYFTLSRHSKIIELNLRGAQLLGRQKLTLKGKLFSAFITVESKPVFDHFVEKIFETNLSQTCELSLAMDGRPPMFLHLEGSLTDNGEHCFLTMLDISARKEKEDKIRQLSQAVEQSPVSIIITNTSGSIEYVNSKFAENTGYNFEEVKGKNIAVLNSGHTTDEEYAALWQALKEGCEWHGEFHNKKKNGQFYWESAAFSCIQNTAGETTHYLAITEDITYRKHSEARLVKYAKELKNVNSDLENFAFIASHDLQEPLRMVNSFLNLVERRLDSQLDETTRQYIRFVIDGADRMKILIRDLLQYSRIGTNKEEFSAVDLNAVFAHLQNVLRETIDLNNAVIKVQSLPVIIANDTLVHELLLNLLTNALKYRGYDPPQIEAGCVEETSRYVLFVKDNGIGINVEYFDKIFIIFQRLHARSSYPGTGIGLAICRRIAELHKGKIWVESEEGKGSTFFVSFPKSAE